ncbi:MAG: hypothetical protein AAGF47_06955 [Planctomycetota bacterium]
MKLRIPKSRVRLVSAESCVWAVLKPSDRRAHSRHALDYEFERFVSKPIESYATDYIKLTDGAVLACGIDTETIASVVTTYDSVRPDSVPTWLTDVNVDIAQFELAQGAHRPKRVRKAVLAAWATAACVGIGLSSLITVGLSMRAAESRTRAADLRVLADRAYSVVLPEASNAGQPRALIVRGLLRQARDSSAADEAGSSFDASLAVQDLLGSLGRDLGLRVNRISARDGTVAIDTETNRDPGEIITALESVVGWQVGSPAIRRSGSDSRITVALTPSNGSSRGGS